MDQTNETCKNTDLVNCIDEIKECIEAYPYDDWDRGWNAAIRHVLFVLDKYDIKVV